MHDNLPAPLLPGARRDALTAAIAALEAAQRGGRPAELSHALAQAARCYRELGQLGQAEAHVQQALRWAGAVGATDACLELLCEAAELALMDDQPSRARELAEEVARMARHAADPGWELSVLMRASDVLDRVGEHGQAIALHCRALSLITQDHLNDPQTRPMPLSPAFSTSLL